jgi:hypothetical protein
MMVKVDYEWALHYKIKKKKRNCQNKYGQNSTQKIERDINIAENKFGSSKITRSKPVPVRSDCMETFKE